MTQPTSGATGASSASGGGFPPTQSIPTHGVPSSSAPWDSAGAPPTRPVDEAAAFVGGQHGATTYGADHGLGQDGHPEVADRSVGQLIGEVTQDLSTLMRQELDLAKAELTAEAKKAGQGAGLFGAAGFAGYMAIFFLSLAMWGALHYVIDWGWAGLVVAAVWAIIGAVAFVVGRKRFQQLHPKPERTVQTLQQVPGALKPN